MYRGTGFWLIGVDMVEGYTSDATDWPPSVRFFLDVTVCLEKWRKCPFPVLWRWLGPMVIILNKNIVLALFLFDTLDRIQKKYYIIMSLHVIYCH